MSETTIRPFVEVADRLRPQINAALEDYLNLPHGCPETLQEAMRYSLLAPGKRLRPMLVLMAAEACGGTLEAAMPAACAVEMVHTYSLIHDDLPVIDNDDLRRGQPTCHIAFGEAVAILTGDALLALAFEVLADEVKPPAVAAQCCAVLAEAAGPCQLVGGQTDDISGMDLHSDLEVLESIHYRKTGALFNASLHLGGMTAGAENDLLAALDSYGRRLGLAFQITDDLLDVRSDEETTGKRVRKDAEHGKLTFPGLLGIDESAAEARCLVDEAIAALAPLKPRTEGLEALALFVLERNR
jgi:geranylgeranyl diphosphate synthase type II